MKECFNEARPPRKNKREAGPKWAHSKKNHSHAHTLSLPPPRTGGKKEEREREQQRKREPTHTHTLAHTSVPVKPEWRDNKEAGR